MVVGQGLPALLGVRPLRPTLCTCPVGPLPPATAPVDRLAGRSDDGGVATMALNAFMTVKGQKQGDIEWTWTDGGITSTDDWLAPVV